MTKSAGKSTAASGSTAASTSANNALHQHAQHLQIRLQHVTSADVWSSSVTDEDSEDYTEGSESEASEAEEEEMDMEGTPPLPTDDHCHVFIYHSSNPDSNDKVEHYIQVIENSPYYLKVMTSHHDFKSGCSPIENITWAMGLSLRTVIVLDPEFIRDHLEHFEAAATQAMSDEDQRKLKTLVLVSSGMALPPSMETYPHVFHMDDGDSFENVTKLLMTAPVFPSSGGRRTSKSAVDPDSIEDNSHQTGKDQENGGQPEPKEPTTIYPNGYVVRRVTACNYSDYEKRDAESGLCQTYCPRSDLFCPKQEPEYIVPASLTKRGLQVTQDELTEILDSLTDSSNVTFFQKAVDCSLPCLFLSTIIACGVVSCLMWFLIVGGLNYHRADEDISSGIFWSFIIFVFFIPGVVSLIMLGVVLHLVNYKFLKYRIRIEELNKRLRETNLVLHVRKGYWSCSGKFKLYFIYYNFEDCQQTLYCHVHDSMKILNTSGQQTPENERLLHDSSTVKIDRIMKRVNTLTKKFEWDYFEALTKSRLPTPAQIEHRKKGMCFCQYVIDREEKPQPLSIVEQVKDHMGSMRKNALKKSHRRRSTRTTSAGSLSYYKSPTFDSTIANV